MFVKGIHVMVSSGVLHLNLDFVLRLPVVFDCFPFRTTSIMILHSAM